MVINLLKFSESHKNVDSRSSVNPKQDKFKKNHALRHKHRIPTAWNGWKPKIKRLSWRHLWKMTTYIQGNNLNEYSWMSKDEETSSECWKKKNTCQSMILYPMELSFKNKGPPPQKKKDIFRYSKSGQSSDLQLIVYAIESSGWR